MIINRIGTRILRIAKTIFWKENLCVHRSLPKLAHEIKRKDSAHVKKFITSGFQTAAGRGSASVLPRVLFPTIYNNCKLCIVLQFIIILNFRASLRTKQYYWLKNCLLALRAARALAKFCEVDPVPVSENSFNNN